MKNETESTDVVVVECDLPDPPERVWRALTVPELLAAWLMPNDIRPQVGTHFRFQPETQKTGEEGGSIDCKVLAAEPNRLLRYSWRGSESEHDAEGHSLDSIVTFELSRTATGGTHLRLVHTAFPLSSRQPHAILGGATAFASNTRILSSEQAMTDTLAEGASARRATVIQLTPRRPPMQQRRTKKPPVAIGSAHRCLRRAA
jgi:uncharacterized protein YndB with AHSA1/START domain